MNKKYLTFGFMGLFVMAFAAATLVDYYGQQKVDMTIESPVVLHGGDVEITLIAGNGYNLYLVEGENFLDRDVDVEFRFSLLDAVGNDLVNTEGFYLAYSSDIDYAYNEEYGNASNWTEAQTWMNTNLDWFDWYLTSDLSKYDATIITNHGGNSAHNVLSFNTAIAEDLAQGKFYAVVYLDVDEAVIPGDYTFSVDMMPVVA